MAIENGKETAEKTQISWGDLGDNLVCNIPGISETIYFNMTELHETWQDFIKRYGVAQWIGSALAKHSTVIPAEIAIAYKTAQMKVLESIAAKDAPETIKMLEVELASRKAEIKALKIAGAKAKSGAVKTTVFEMMKSLKSEMTEKARITKESKAAIEARVKAETIAKMATGLKAIGLTDEQIATAVANL